LSPRQLPANRCDSRRTPTAVDFAPLVDPLELLPASDRLPEGMLGVDNRLSSLRPSQGASPPSVIGICRNAVGGDVGFVQEPEGARACAPSALLAFDSPCVSAVFLGSNRYLSSLLKPHRLSKPCPARDTASCDEALAWTACQATCTQNPA
jgi:hypothetical protein